MDDSASWRSPVYYGGAQNGPNERKGETKMTLREQVAALVDKYGAESVVDAMAAHCDTRAERAEDGGYPFQVRGWQHAKQHLQRAAISLADCQIDN